MHTKYNILASYEMFFYFLVLLLLLIFLILILILILIFFFFWGEVGNPCASTCIIVGESGVS